MPLSPLRTLIRGRRGLTDCRAVRRRHVHVPATLQSGAKAPAAEDNGTPVTINGWIQSVRRQKKVAFAHVSDGRSLKAVQAVLDPVHAESLSTGAAVSLDGFWQASKGEGQIHELRVTAVNTKGQNDAASYPIQKKYQTPEFLRTLPHLRMRLPFNSLLLKLRSEIIGNITRYFTEEGFIQTHPPLITSSDCEGAGEVFIVGTSKEQTDEEGNILTSMDGGSFFRLPKYLTVSSQLHLEALAQSVGSVWTLSPTFRAERSDTPRHLSEFYMLEAEACFVEDLGAIMDVVEGLLKSIANYMLSAKIGEELITARDARQDQNEEAVSGSQLHRRLDALQRTFPRITYREAVNELQRAEEKGAHFEFRPVLGESLQAEHEKYLAKVVGNNGPLFVTDYPRDQKAFYMAPSHSQELGTGVPTVACFDLLVPDICELAGGSMREHRLNELLENMGRFNMLRKHDGAVNGLSKSPGTASSNTSVDEAVPPNLRWYTDLRRYGSVPHGGFGIGFDRLLCYISGVSNIRDVVAFPRWHGRCDC